MKDLELTDWDKVVNEVRNEVYDRIVRRTPVDTGTARDGWVLAQEGSVATINNDVPYIDELEEGSSKQAPNGMVRITLEEVPDILDTVLKNN